MGAISEAFTRTLNQDAKVILGARVSEAMYGRVRVILLLSGLTSSD